MIAVKSKPLSCSQNLHTIRFGYTPNHPCAISTSVTELPDSLWGFLPHFH